MCLDGAAEVGHAVGAEAALGGGDEHRQDDGRGRVHRHRNGGVLAREVEAGEEPLHVLDRVDGDAAFADFAEHALGVGVHAVERGAVKRGGEAQALLVFAEVVETLVGVLREAQAGEETHRFLAAAALVEIHLAVGGIGVGELSG